MIDPKELRIGNWVGDIGSVPFQVDGVDIVALIQSQLSGKINIGYNPIPLTEEWLVKFGFEKSRMQSFEYFKGNFGVDMISNGGYSLNVRLRDGSCFERFYFVHQLQNLYYPLAGEELTITSDQPTNASPTS